MKLFLFFFMFLTFLLLLLLSEIISFFWGFLIKMFDILLISVKVFLSYLSCCNCLQTVEMNYGIKKGKWTLYLRHGRLGMWSAYKFVSLNSAPSARFLENAYWSCCWQGVLRIISLKKNLRSPIYNKAWFNKLTFVENFLHHIIPRNLEIRKIGNLSSGKYNLEKENRVSTNIDGI